MKLLNKAAILFFVASVLLCGCGNEVQPDAASAASLIREQIRFDDALEPVEPEITAALYGFESESIEASASYMGSGATAEEITVVTFKSLGDEQKQLFEQRIAAQKQSYAGYVPAELERLENAVIEYYGNTAVLCVSKDANARQTIKKILKDSKK